MSLTPLLGAAFPGPGVSGVAMLAIACALGLGVGLLALARLGASPRARGPLRDESGTASLEFCIILPILLFMTLTLAQSTLVLAGNIFVHHAAFVATRAAIVQAGQDTGYGRNQVSNESGDPKLEAVRKAAVFALVPVSGRVESGSAPGPAYANGMADVYRQYNREVPNWLKPHVASSARFRSYNISGIEAGLYYADLNTLVYFMETEVLNQDDVEFRRIEGVHTLGPKDPVTVQVEHRLHLGVPYVRWIFSDTQVTQTPYETRWGGQVSTWERDKEAEDRKYRTITAQTTLHNEGIDDRLPPTPSIPRIP